LAQFDRGSNLFHTFGLELDESVSTKVGHKANLPYVVSQFERAIVAGM